MGPNGDARVAGAFVSQPRRAASIVLALEPTAPLAEFSLHRLAAGDERLGDLVKAAFGCSVIA